MYYHIYYWVSCGMCKTRLMCPAPYDMLVWGNPPLTKLQCSLDLVEARLPLLVVSEPPLDDRKDLRLPRLHQESMQVLLWRRTRTWEMESDLNT